ncbi:class F sortase [Nakamurella lactea]|uniref:class F sortase n=1 Tax=Nakamurella lactea TaxID=459515 RepID=UPI0003FA729A|nr:class F sortase [Nakamurella lactea]
MTPGAGHGNSRARRRGLRTVMPAAALLLLVAGTIAVAVGLFRQQEAPPAPAPAAAGQLDALPDPPSAGRSVTGASAIDPAASSMRTLPAAPSSAPASPPVSVAPAPSAPPTSPVSSPSASTSSPAAPPEVVPPESIRIPSIGVSSDLLGLGLAADGSLAVPTPGPDYDKAAWFTGSPAPGSPGPAVIEGHVDSSANGPSVFYRLGEIAIGDPIRVTRSDGSVLSFRVYAVRSYPKDAFPTLDVYGNTAGPELRLITCGGSFDSGSGHYLANTVAFARLS